MMLAWLVFWVNTALFPCCEAIAAVFDGHADIVSPSANAALPSHHSDTSHSEDARHSPASLCDFALNAGPTIIDSESAALPTERVQLVWLTIATSVAPDLTAVNHAVYRVPREYHPPPQPRVYLHTQRLLI